MSTVSYENSYRIHLSLLVLLVMLVISGCSSSSDDQPSNNADSSASNEANEIDESDSGTNTSPDNESQNDPASTGEQESTTEPVSSGTTRVDFDITVPVYVSNSLQVRLVWGEKNLTARWVTDESWAISDNLPTNTEHVLRVTFSDKNGAITLGTAEADFKTGTDESEFYQLTADQFDTDTWDSDGDGLSNLAESRKGTDPLVEDILEPVRASLVLVADKTFRFSWQPSAGAETYRVLENADGMSGFVQIGGDLRASSQGFDHRVALYRRVNARYVVQACNAAGCVDSEELIVSGSLESAVGYFKASNSDKDDNFGESVSLNADGSLLAVGTYLEDSAASAVNGAQVDNSAEDTGAVYVFARIDERWQQQAYIKASNPDTDDLFGISISLSGDGKTLAVGTPYEDSAATGINGNQNDNSAENAGAVYIFTSHSGNWQQQAYVKASNTNARDGFGSIVLLNGDGNTLLVSAYREDSAARGINGNEGDNSVLNSGAVYVFTRDSGNWQQQAYLKASNADEEDSFGTALGLSADGDVLAVGASNEASAATGVNGDQSNNRASGAGAVYLFERIGGSWQQQAYIKASNTDSRDIFGVRLSLSADGETLAVAAYGERSAATGINGNQNDDTTSNAGAVYVFDKSAGDWQQQAYVKSSNGELNDFFGISVSLSGNGDTLVVGAFFEDSAGTGIGSNQFDNSLSSSGAAYVFERENGSWQQQAYLKASNNNIDAWFGFSSSLSSDGETLAIGARYERNNAIGINGNQNNGQLIGSGAVYLY